MNDDQAAKIALLADMTMRLALLVELLAANLDAEVPAEVFEEIDQVKEGFAGLPWHHQAKTGA